MDLQFHPFQRSNALYSQRGFAKATHSLSLTQLPQVLLFAQYTQNLIF